MSSPCKRIKLTPKEQQNSSRARFTLESKVTSTPQRRSGKVDSPNLSRISSSSSASSHLSPASNNFNAEQIEESSLELSTSGLSNRSPSTSVSIAESEGSLISVEDYDTYINNIHKIKYTGNVWKLHKPLHDDTLYAEILSNPGNVQELVGDLFIAYDRNRKQALLKLLILCADVSGYQHFKITDHFSEDTKSIIEMMQNEKILEQQACLITTRRYLLMEPKTNLGQIMKISIYNFLQKLIYTAHEMGILYDNFFSTHFFKFIKDMSFSRISSIRHTGVIFSIKILTAIVNVYIKLIEEENFSRKQRSAQKQIITDYLEFFYVIFFKNCRLQDIKLLQMRVDCTHELNVWIRCLPKIFITQLEAANVLMKLITDPSKDIRLAALKICQGLVGTSSILVLLQNAVPSFTEYIAGRFLDCDIFVAIKAIDIYNLLLKYDDALITTKTLKMLINLVFDKYFPIGKVASRCLIYYLGKTESNEETMLVQLAKLSMKPGDAIIPLLVEGCLDECFFIRDWKLYINILLSNDVELDIKKHLVELFTEAVHQVLVGSATILREKSRKVDIVDPNEHLRIVNYFPYMISLLKKYKDYPNILASLVQIFTKVQEANLNEVSFETFKIICSVIEKLFDYHSNEMLLKKLCDTFHYFSNVPAHTNYIQGVVDSILEKYKNELETSLSNPDTECGSVILKISILFEKFNLSKQLKWETLFDSWDDVDQATSGLLLSCKWYLIWSLKNITASEMSSSHFQIQIRMCREFTSTCFNMLQNLKGQPLHFKTYECLCDLHITYMQELDELTKSFKQMEQLQLVITEKPLQTVLLSFLEQYVIHNTNMPLSERRSYIVRYFDLVHLNVLPIECLGNIYKYYYQCNKEYGHIIDFSLSSIEAGDENVCLMLVLCTITLRYEMILNKYNAVDMTTQEAKDLKLLIKQFLNYKGFKAPSSKFMKIIYFAINYSVKQEANFALLYFMKYFVDILTDNEDRKELSRFLKNKVPKTTEKNDAVLFLANCLKSRTGDSAQKLKPTKTSHKNKENIRSKKPIEKSHKRGRRKVPCKQISKDPIKNTDAKTKKGNDTETDMSEDDLTIHDSESDNFEESLANLQV